MSDLPAAAVTAAAEMLTRSKHSWIPATGAEKAMDHATARKMLEAAAPHLTAAAAAAERRRIISLASQLRATIPADHPEGAQASFADYLRVTEGETT